MTISIQTENLEAPSAESIRLMADMIVSICTCVACGEISAEAELLEFLHPTT